MKIPLPCCLKRSLYSERFCSCNQTSASDLSSGPDLPTMAHNSFVNDKTNAKQKNTPTRSLDPNTIIDHSLMAGINYIFIENIPSIRQCPISHPYRPVHFPIKIKFNQTHLVSFTSKRLSRKCFSFKKL